MEAMRRSKGSEDDRPFLSGAPLRPDGPRQKQGHGPGEDRPFLAPSERVSFQAAQEGLARFSGHRSAQVPDRHFRARVLLAPTSGLQESFRPGSKSGFLGEKIISKHC